MSALLQLPMWRRVFLLQTLWTLEFVQEKVDQVLILLFLLPGGQEAESYLTPGPEVPNKRRSRVKGSLHAKEKDFARSRSVGCPWEVVCAMSRG